MDNPKPLYCTVQDHMDMARHNFDTCPKCGGSTQERFSIDKGIEGVRRLLADTERRDPVWLWR